MKLGTNDIGSVYLGTNEISKVYLGTNLVWESGFDADYQAILDYATTQGYTLPSATQQILQNQLVKDLKSAGVWTKLDTFGVFATDGDEDFALIDWIRLTQYTAVNSPSFTTNVGFTGNGTSSYLLPNFNPSTDGVNYTASDASFGVYWDSSLTASNYFVFARAGSDVSASYLNTALPTNQINSNTTTNRRTFSTNGDFKAVTLSSGIQRLILDGSIDDTFSFSGTPTLLNNDWRLLSRVGASGYSDATVRMFFIGSDISSEASDFNTAVTTYYNSL